MSSESIVSEYGTEAAATSTAGLPSVEEAEEEVVSEEAEAVAEAPAGDGCPVRPENDTHRAEPPRAGVGVREFSVAGQRP